MYPVLHGMDIGSHEQQHKGEEEDTLQQQEQQQQQQQYQQSEGDSAHKVSTIPGLENKEMRECMDFFQERTGMTSEEFIRSLKAPPGTQTCRFTSTHSRCDVRSN